MVNLLCYLLQLLMMDILIDIYVSGSLLFTKTLLFLATFIIVEWSFEF